MNKWKFKIGQLIAIFVGILLISTSGFAQKAQLQIIHNSADPAAGVVDLYLNGDLLFDDVPFRAATPILEVPANTGLELGIAPGNSTSAADIIERNSVNIEPGQTCVAIANGVLDPAAFAVNPDGISTKFKIFVVENVRQSSLNEDNVDLIVFHGATDAPAVDVIARDVAKLVNNLSYTDATAYISVPAGVFTLDITPAKDNETIVASFVADLSTLAGGTAIVLASGFLDPGMNQGGEGFGLIAVLPNGDVVEFPAEDGGTPETARLQAIHNAADPAAATVDVYLDGNLLVDDFGFRTATPFIDAPAGTPIDIGIAPGNSSSAADVIASFTATLESGQTYVAIANGVLDPSSFADNPDSVSTAFTLFLRDEVREAATTGGNIDFIAVHGATDAPTVDVIARGVATLVDNAAYSDITPYISVPEGTYTLDVTPGDDNATVVASFVADLNGLGGGAAVVLASGFLDPGMNQGGEGFGLIAVLPNGDVVEFPAEDGGTPETARLQAIHNAADPAAALVDVYLDGNLLVDDFGFRTATPFIDAPAGTPIDIGIAPGNSSSAADVIASFTATLESGQTYVAIANGVLDPSSFADNPDSVSTAFTLFLRDEVREAATTGGNIDFIAVHGATDAPTVDVIARGVATLVDNAAYSDITPYISVPEGTYTLDVTPGDDNATVVASFVADLNGLGGGAAVVLASGFLDPGMNQGGEGFGLIAVLPNGDVVEFPAEGSGTSETARLQMIHNAADPAAALVDVYLDGNLLVDDFGFRTATPFVDAPAGIPIDIGVAPGNSTSVADVIANFHITLESGQTYVAVASGVLNSDNFTQNPDGLNTSFAVFFNKDIRETGSRRENVDFIAFHGATDGPRVAIATDDVTTLFDNISYSDMTAYVSMPADFYTMDVSHGDDSANVLMSCDVDLSDFGGKAGVILASGFLNPEDNQNGPQFSMIGILASGAVIEFQERVTTSVGENGGSVPTAFELGQNYPNPFNPSTSISFAIPLTQTTVLKVFDVRGREVATLVDRELGAGNYTISFEAANLASGVYFYKLKTRDFVQTRRMIIMK